MLSPCAGHYILLPKFPPSDSSGEGPGQQTTRKEGNKNEALPGNAPGNINQQAGVNTSHIGRTWVKRSAFTWLQCVISVEGVAVSFSFPSVCLSHCSETVLCPEVCVTCCWWRGPRRTGGVAPPGVSEAANPRRQTNASRCRDVLLLISPPSAPAMIISSSEAFDSPAARW